MSFEMFLETLKFLWIPLLAFAYNIYSESQKKQDDEIEAIEKRICDRNNILQEKQDKKIEELEKRVSHQMTKQDVIEVVNNAITLLSTQIKLDLQKIDAGLHQIKTQVINKDSSADMLNHTMLNVAERLEEILKK